MLNVKEFVEAYLNPVRLRIMQELKKTNKTTKELHAVLTDIPRATLYWHINILLKAGCILVAEERKVRGKTERLLATHHENYEKSNTTENGAIAATAFMTSRLATFVEYFSTDDADPFRDRLAFGTYVFLADDDEFEQFHNELHTVLRKYTREFKEPKEGRKMRDVSVIYSPVIKEKK